MLGIGSVDVRVERSVDALCALSEWDGFSNTLERGRGKAAYEKGTTLPSFSDKPHCTFKMHTERPQTSLAETPTSCSCPRTP